eukprot:gb/GFBE01035687.1/.p1 GENE.gb/GFBE01035687.1/~~gb/GFBE01035687.1/.p1  ORF type:complete len:130 (+),score=24.73 gb/GFBE01035687.1/:1-390(+)
MKRPLFRASVPGSGEDQKFRMETHKSPTPQTSAPGDAHGGTVEAEQGDLLDIESIVLSDVLDDEPEVAGVPQRVDALSHKDFIAAIQRAGLMQPGRELQQDGEPTDRPQRVVAMDHKDFMAAIQRAGLH